MDPRDQNDGNETDVAPDPKKGAFDAIIELLDPLPVSHRYDVLKAAMIFLHVDPNP